MAENGFDPEISSLDELETPPKDMSMHHNYNRLKACNLMFAPAPTTIQRTDLRHGMSDRGISPPITLRNPLCGWPPHDLTQLMLASEETTPSNEKLPHLNSSVASCLRIRWLTTALKASVSSVVTPDTSVKTARNVLAHTHQ